MNTLLPPPPKKKKLEVCTCLIPHSIIVIKYHNFDKKCGLKCMCPVMSWISHSKTYNMYNYYEKKYCSSSSSLCFCSSLSFCFLFSTGGSDRYTSLRPTCEWVGWVGVTFMFDYDCSTLSYSFLRISLRSLQALFSLSSWATLCSSIFSSCSLIRLSFSLPWVQPEHSNGNQCVLYIQPLSSSTTTKRNLNLMCNWPSSFTECVPFLLLLLFLEEEIRWSQTVPPDGSQWLIAFAMPDKNRNT